MSWRECRGVNVHGWMHRVNGVNVHVNGMFHHPLCEHCSRLPVSALSHAILKVEKVMPEELILHLIMAKLAERFPSTLVRYSATLDRSQKVEEN